ncbi:MAG TPA: potassium channel family protein [Thermoanaerobaculia bacterium]
MTRPKPLGSLWQSDWGLSALLAFACLALFVGAPLADTGGAGQIAFDVLFSLVLVSGVVAVGRRPLLTAAVAALTAATLGFRWASFRSPGSPAELWGFALSIALLSVLAALVLMQVFREGPITGYRIQGAVVVYLLVGFAWAAAYEVVYRAWPGAFQFAQRATDETRLTHGLLYYSFVTLTTVGYGDITPIHPVARSLAMSEALIGQLYPAILIARLVSMRIAARRDG